MPTTSTRDKQQQQPEDDVTDPFANLDALRLSQDYGAELGVQKMLLRVPVRRPGRQEFVRAHPDPTYVLDTGLIELSDERDYYLTMPAVRAGLFDEIRAIRLHTVVNRQGVVFLWPCRLPGSDGRGNAWHESALEIAELAKTAWVRVVADRSLGAYQAYRAAGDLDPPEWPDKSFPELLKVAFSGGRIIHNEDHPVIRRLLGQS